MAITSFQKFLKSDKPKAPDYIRFLQLLLQGMALHAAEGAADDLSRFRARISAVSEGLNEQSSSEELLVALTAVMQALEEQNRTASNFMKAHTVEMQAMLAMMSSTIAFLAKSSNLGVEQLQTIERHLETTSNIDDVRLSRLKLSECLTVVRNESMRLREDSQKHIQALNQTLESTANKMRSLSVFVDPVTGLRARSDAEQVIASCITEGSNVTLALFVIDRLASINMRFGRKVGDDILLLIAQHLGERLPKDCPLFRWSGPAFLGVVEIKEGTGLTERQIRQIASTRLEKNIDGPDRTVLLPISCSVVLEKITSSDSAEDVCHKLDKTLASIGAAG